MTPHRQMRRLFLKNKKLIISVALQIRENALWLYRRVLESVCGANRGLPETCVEPFSFRCAEFAAFFAGQKAEQTFFSDFNTPCDSSFIRTNRTWLIAKTARCARSFCDDYNRHNGYSCFHGFSTLLFFVCFVAIKYEFVTSTISARLSA